MLKKEPNIILIFIIFFIIRSTGKGADSLDFCGGEWKYPRTCSFEDKTCDYSARWKFDENTDMIDFTIKTRFTDKWTGIGFSDTPQMVILVLSLYFINVSKISHHFQNHENEILVH